MSLPWYENSGSLCDILANVVKHTCVCAKEVRHMQNCQPMRSCCHSISVFWRASILGSHNLHTHTKGQTQFFGADTQQLCIFNVSMFHSSVLKVVFFPLMFYVSAGELSGCADGLCWFHFPLY